MPIGCLWRFVRFPLFGSISLLLFFSWAGGELMHRGIAHECSAHRVITGACRRQQRPGLPCVHYTLAGTPLEPTCQLSSEPFKGCVLGYVTPW